MQLRSIFYTATLIVAAAAPAASFAANDKFMNGQYRYGQPAAAASDARVVDAARTSRVNAVYGETIVFRADGGQQFAWTFNGLGQRSVQLAKIAPAGFGSKTTVIYIGSDPALRN